MRQRNGQDKEMGGHDTFETMIVTKAKGWWGYCQASFKMKRFFFSEYMTTETLKYPTRSANKPEQGGLPLLTSVTLLAKYFY